MLLRKYRNKYLGVYGSLRLCEIARHKCPGNLALSILEYTGVVFLHYCTTLKYLLTRRAERTEATEYCNKTKSQSRLPNDNKAIRDDMPMLAVMHRDDRPRSLRCTCDFVLHVFITILILHYFPYQNQQ